VVFFAIGLSLLVHALLLPLVHAPAVARTPKEQRASIFTMRHAPLPPTPRPTPVPPRATPHPVVAHPAVVRKRTYVVHVTPPRTNPKSSTQIATTSSKLLAARTGPGGSLGDPHAAPGLVADGPIAATGAPQSDATPVETPAPIASKPCPAEPHDAVVTQAVTPDRPQAAIDEDAVGRVVVEVQLARDGSVVHAGVHTTSGFASLDRAAVDAAAHARYAPASDGCEPIAGSYLYVVEFTE
jgi:protein TonB